MESRDDKKQGRKNRKLQLSKETIRRMLSDSELKIVHGGDGTGKSVVGTSRLGDACTG